MSLLKLSRLGHVTHCRTISRVSSLRPALISKFNQPRSPAALTLIPIKNPDLILIRPFGRNLPVAKFAHSYKGRQGWFMAILLGVLSALILQFIDWKFIYKKYGIWIPIVSDVFCIVQVIIRKIISIIVYCIINCKLQCHSIINFYDLRPKMYF